MYGGNRYLLRTLLMFFVGVCCLRVQAQTSPAQTSPGASQSAPVDATDRTSSSHLLANSNAKLGIGDLIDVTVYGVPDLSTKARVSGSGDIYLPLIDYVHVSDLTTDEAQDLIQKRLEGGRLCPQSARFDLRERSRLPIHYFIGRSSTPRLLRSNWRAAALRCDLCGRRIDRESGPQCDHRTSQRPEG